MESRVKLWPKDERWPRLMVDKLGIIILAQHTVDKRLRGTVVGHTRDASPTVRMDFGIAYHSSEWELDLFTNFDGEVTLENGR